MSYFHRLIYVVTFIVALIKGLEVLVPMSHGDALYYHLPIAKLWLETNFKQMHQDLCGSLQGGIFDYLYVIPIGIFGSTIIGQIASQALYYIFGVVTALIVSIKKLDLTDIYKAFAVLIFMTIAVESDFFIYAKNDAVLAAFGFMATLEIVEDYFTKDSKKIFIKALFLGCLPLIKINGLLISAILGIYYLYRVRNLKQSLLVGGTSLLIATPILIRNFYFIESPFYPALLSAFPGALHPGEISYYQNAMSASPTLSSLAFHLKAFFAFKIVIAFTILSQFKKLIVDKNLLHYFYISCSIFISYLFLNGGVEASRFYFICFFLNAFITLALFKGMNSRVLIIVFVLILVDSKIDKAFKRIKTTLSRATNSESLVEFTNKNIPLSEIWNFIPADSKILTDNWSQLFHAKKGVRVYQYQCNKEAYFLNDCDDISKLSNFDYVILAKFKNTMNICTEHIRTRYTKLTELNEYELYQKP